MASFIYKHSERNNEEFIEYLKEKLSQKDTQGCTFSSAASPHGIQMNSMNQRHISDRPYPPDYAPNITSRDLNRLFELNR